MPRDEHYLTDASMRFDDWLRCPYPPSWTPEGEPRLDWIVFLTPDHFHPDHEREMERRVAERMAGGAQAGAQTPARWLSGEACARLLQDWIQSLRPRAQVDFSQSTVGEFMDALVDGEMLLLEFARDFRTPLAHFSSLAIGFAMLHYYWFWVALREPRFCPLIEVRQPHSGAVYLQELLQIATLRGDWADRSDRRKEREERERLFARHLS